MSIRTGQGPQRDDLVGQFFINIGQAEGRLPGPAVINSRRTAVIAVGRAEKHKGIHLAVNLADGLKHHGRQPAAEDPAGMGHNAGHDGVGQIAGKGLLRKAFFDFRQTCRAGGGIKLACNGWFSNHFLFSACVFNAGILSYLFR